MCRSSIEVEFELVELGLSNDNGILGEGDTGAGFASGFEKEDAVPVGAASGDVIDVKDQVREAFVEDARLHLKGNLRDEETGFDVAKSAKAAGGKDKGHQQSQHRAEDSEDSDREKDAFTANPEGSQRNDFAIHGHAAQSEKDPDEDCHGDGEDKNPGDDAEEQGEDLRPRTGMAHEEFHEADELGDEEHEGEDKKAQEGVADDFANNVTIEDAHGAKGQCNMGKRAIRSEPLAVSKRRSDEARKS